MYVCMYVSGVPPHKIVKRKAGVSIALPMIKLAAGILTFCMYRRTEQAGRNPCYISILNIIQGEMDPTQVCVCIYMLQ
jgi:hypothetical protein